MAEIIEAKKALSIRQPWAMLIMRGIKKIELRTWDTHYRGRLYIHAGKQKEPEAIVLWVTPETKAQVIYGAILGYVNLQKTVLLDPKLYKIEKDSHLSKNYWIEGLFGWYLENPVVFENPIPYKGQLGLFTLKFDLEEQFRKVSVENTVKS